MKLARLRFCGLPQTSEPSGDVADSPRSETATSPVCLTALFALSALLALLALVATAQAQLLEPHTRTLNFGIVAGNAPAERPLVVINRGTGAVRIRSIEATPPLSLAGIPPAVEPGQSAEILVRLGAPRTTGRYEGSLTVGFEGGGEPLAIEVNAVIVVPVEIVPPAGVVAETERGIVSRASAEIVSHLGRPLELSSGATSNERFATALETIETGKRYRLNLVMTGKGPAGDRVDTIQLETGDPEHPVVSVPVRTQLRERFDSDRADAGSPADSLAGSNAATVQ